MSNHAFDVSVRNEEDLSLLDLVGTIDSEAQEKLNAAYSEAEASSAKRILLNFTDVSYINSTGIALIVGLLAKARQSKRQLMTCGLSEHYLEIFQITRLSDFMEVLPDEKSARASLTL